MIPVSANISIYILCAAIAVSIFDDTSKEFLWSKKFGPPPIKNVYQFSLNKDMPFIQAFCLDIKLLELFKALSIYKLNKSILIIKEYIMAQHTHFIRMERKKKKGNLNMVIKLEFGLVMIKKGIWFIKVAI